MAICRADRLGRWPGADFRPIILNRNGVIL